VTRGVDAASWQPAQVEFWKRDALEVLKDMVGDVRLAPNMTWSPKKLYNADRTRLYGELWSGDWWWNKQVFPLKLSDIFVDSHRRARAQQDRLGGFGDHHTNHFNV